MEELTNILLQSKTASDALRELLSFFREYNPNISLAYICKKTGFPSRGALSEVIKGKRRLNPKFKGAMSDVFGLDPRQKMYFDALVELSYAKDPATIVEFHAKLELARKAFQAKTLQIRDIETNDFFSMDLVAVFGLFGDSPTRADLVRFFGRDSAILIDDTLGRLILQCVIEKRGDSFVVVDQNIFLLLLNDPAVLKKLIQKHLALLARHLEQRDFRNLAEAACYVGYLNVKGSKLQEFHRQLDALIKAQLSGQIADDADTLLHFAYFSHTIKPQNKT